MGCDEIVQPPLSLGFEDPLGACCFLKTSGCSDSPIGGESNRFVPSRVKGRLVTCSGNKQGEFMVDTQMLSEAFSSREGGPGNEALCLP